MGSVWAHVETTNVEESDDAGRASGEQSAGSRDVVWFWLRRAISFDDEISNRAPKFYPEESPDRPWRPDRRGYVDPCRKCISDDELINARARNRKPIYRHIDQEGDIPDRVLVREFLGGHVQRCSGSSSSERDLALEGLVARFEKGLRLYADSLLEDITDKCNKELAQRCRRGYAPPVPPADFTHVATGAAQVGAASDDSLIHV